MMEEDNLEENMEEIKVEKKVVIKVENRLDPTPQFLLPMQSTGRCQAGIL